MNENNWYVVYTRPRCELKVANLLARKHITNYCPLHIVENLLIDSKKVTLAPLFPSFVFVCIPKNEMRAVLQTQGIINYLYWLDKPATVAPDEMQSLFNLLKENNKVRLEKCNVHNKTIDCLEDESTSLDIKIKLPSLGYYVIAKSDHAIYEKVYNT